ncbi:cytochrome P450 [Pseudonocardia spinosispora]|uniref:cytochrome P450 n=1 Tax=Pseudonocardia spinosispora TaxID=103441 RepID=UPI0003FDF542|nr:cytochrome P450 [Pseudonocardia spinosispora]
MSYKPGDINLGDPDQLLEVGNPPHEYFTVLRNEAPIFWNPAPPKDIGGSIPLERGFWVLSKWEDVSLASRDSSRFSSWLGGPVIYDVELNQDPRNPWTLDSQRMGLMGKDGQHHAAYRKLVSAGFTPKNIAALKPMITEHAARIVNSVRDMDDAEFIFTVAAELPMLTLCEMMGVPPSDWNMVFEWGNKAAAVEDPTIDAGENMAAMVGYFQSLVEEKRRNPDKSMLSSYANKMIDGERLTDMDINLFCLTLSIAGHETTRNTTAHVIRLISEHPEQRSLLMEDLHARLPNAIEETLRFSPPVMQFRRTATEDIELRGTRVAKGDKVYLSYASANRDEEVFADSQKFDILRTDVAKHLSFGAGPHFCMGNSLARIQLSAILTELLTVRPDVHVTAPPTKARSIWFNAMTAMPVEFGKVADQVGA